MSSYEFTAYALDGENDLNKIAALLSVDKNSNGKSRWFLPLQP